MPKTFRLIALSLVGLAILLGILALSLGKREPTSAPASVDAIKKTPAPQMLIAARNLSAGNPLVLSDVRSVDAPPGASGHFTIANQAVDAIPAQDIAEGTPLHSGLFLSGLSSHLHQGERAIALPIDELAAVGHRIEPGDYVDVYLNLPGDTRNESPQASALSRLLVSRLRVLAIGDASVTTTGVMPPPTQTGSAPEVQAAGMDDRAQTISARSTTSTPPSQTSQSARSAVLAVRPDQAATLLLAAQEGRVTLSLRHPADVDVVNLSLFPAPAASQRLQQLSPNDRAHAGTRREELFYTSLTPLPGTTDIPTKKAAPSHHGNRGIQIIRGNDVQRPLSVQ